MGLGAVDEFGSVVAELVKTRSETAAMLKKKPYELTIQSLELPLVGAAPFGLPVPFSFLFAQVLLQYGCVFVPSKCLGRS